MSFNGDVEDLDLPGGDGPGVVGDIGGSGAGGFSFDSEASLDEGSFSASGTISSDDIINFGVDAGVRVVPSGFDQVQAVIQDAFDDMVANSPYSQSQVAAAVRPRLSVPGDDRFRMQESIGNVSVGGGDVYDFSFNRSFDRAVVPSLPGSGILTEIATRLEDASVTIETFSTGTIGDILGAGDLSNTHTFSPSEIARAFVDVREVDMEALPGPSFEVANVRGSLPDSPGLGSPTPEVVADIRNTGEGAGEATMLVNQQEQTANIPAGSSRTFTVSLPGLSPSGASDIAVAFQETATGQNFATRQVSIDLPGDDQPDEPERPDTPDQPDEPERPDTPDQPDEPSGPSLAVSNVDFPPTVTVGEDFRIQVNVENTGDSPADVRASALGDSQTLTVEPGRLRGFILRPDITSVRPGNLTLRVVNAETGRPVATRPLDITIRPAEDEPPSPGDGGGPSLPGGPSIPGGPGGPPIVPPGQVPGLPDMPGGPPGGGGGQPDIGIDLPDDLEERLEGGIPEVEEPTPEPPEQAPEPPGTPEPPEPPEPAPEPPSRPPTTPEPPEPPESAPEPPEPPAFNILDVDVPDEVPVGRGYDIGVRLGNEGGQPGDVTARVGDVSRTVTISPGSDTLVTLSLSDAGAAVEDGSVEVVNEADGSTVGVEDYTIEMVTPNFAISNVDFPTTVGAGESFTGSFTVQNASDFSGAVAVSAPGVETVEDIPGGSSRTFTVEQDAGPAGDRVFDISIRDDQTGEVADRVSRTVDFVSSDISVTSIQIPQEVQPGERAEAGVNITNSGDAPGNVVVESRNFQQRVTVDAGASETVSVPFQKVAGQAQTIPITVRDGDTGNVIAQRDSVVQTREAEFTLRRIEAPDAAVPGSQFTVTGVVGNDGQAPGTFTLSVGNTSRSRTIGPTEEVRVSVPVRKQGLSLQDVSVGLTGPDGNVSAARSVTVTGIDRETDSGTPSPPQAPEEDSPLPSPFGGDADDPFAALFGSDGFFARLFD